MTATEGLPHLLLVGGLCFHQKIGVIATAYSEDLREQFSDGGGKYILYLDQASSRSLLQR